MARAAGGSPRQSRKTATARTIERSWLDERDHVFKPKLQPNYDGMETGTWKDAREVARSATAKVLGAPIANVVASTYDPLVQKGSA
jgi:hypothetical protein